MRRARVFVDGVEAGVLEEVKKATFYTFTYLPEYVGESVSLLMPVEQMVFEFERFPPFFDGLLPEGMLLEALLKRSKIDRDDLFRQLVTVGAELVGNVTVEEIQ
jgi:serine/threonine-protein kinase HipA